MHRINVAVLSLIESTMELALYFHDKAEQIEQFFESKVESLLLINPSATNGRLQLIQINGKRCGAEDDQQDKKFRLHFFFCFEEVWQVAK